MEGVATPYEIPKMTVEYPTHMKNYSLRRRSAICIARTPIKRSPARGRTKIYKSNTLPAKTRTIKHIPYSININQIRTCMSKNHLSRYNVKPTSKKFRDRSNRRPRDKSPVTLYSADSGYTTLDYRKLDELITFACY